ncbi:MAG: hypothetical protein MRY32_00615 [Rickettsiales bacterium]|nr:hypothetical protein [Rickettsiales bacterium]
MAGEDEEKDNGSGKVTHLDDARHRRDADALRDRPFAPLDSTPAFGGPEHPSDPRSRNYRSRNRRGNRQPGPTQALLDSDLVKHGARGGKVSDPPLSDEARREMVEAGQKSANQRQADHERLPELMQSLYSEVNEAVFVYDALRECMGAEPLAKELRTAPRMETERPRNKTGPHDANTAWQWVRDRAGRQLRLFDEGADYRKPHETQKSGLAAWFKESGDRSVPPVIEADNPVDYSAGFHPGLNLYFSPSVQEGFVNFDPVRPKGAPKDGEERFQIYDKLHEWLGAMRTKHSQGDLFGDGAVSEEAQRCERAMELTTSLRALDAEISSDVKEIQAIDARMQARKG